MTPRTAPAQSLPILSRLGLPFRPAWLVLWLCVSFACPSHASNGISVTWRWLEVSTENRNVSWRAAVDFEVDGLTFPGDRALTWVTGRSGVRFERFGGEPTDYEYSAPVTIQASDDFRDGLLAAHTQDALFNVCPGPEDLVAAINADDESGYRQSCTGIGHCHRWNPGCLGLSAEPIDGLFGAAIASAQALGLSSGELRQEDVTYLDWPAGDHCSNDGGVFYTARAIFQGQAAYRWNLDFTHGMGFPAQLTLDENAPITDFSGAPSSGFASGGAPDNLPGQGELFTLTTHHLFSLKCGPDHPQYQAGYGCTNPCLPSQRWDSNICGCVALQTPDPTVPCAGSDFTDPTKPICLCGPGLDHPENSEEEIQETCGGCGKTGDILRCAPPDDLPGNPGGGGSHVTLEDLDLICSTVGHGFSWCSNLNAAKKKSDGSVIHDTTNLVWFDPIPSEHLAQLQPMPDVCAYETGSGWSDWQPCGEHAGNPWRRPRSTPAEMETWLASSGGGGGGGGGGGDLQPGAGLAVPASFSCGHLQRFGSSPAFTFNLTSESTETLDVRLTLTDTNAYSNYFYFGGGGTPQEEVVTLEPGQTVSVSLYVNTNWGGSLAATLTSAVTASGGTTASHTTALSAMVQ